MTDRPTPDAAPPDQPRPRPPADESPAVPPQPASLPEGGIGPELIERSYAEPIPEPGTADRVAPEAVASDLVAPEAVASGPGVEPIAEPADAPAAPQQIAPDPGAPPIPLEPEPSVPEPIDAASSPPVALEPSTEQTLALPPTTKEVEPAPAPSAPPPPSGVPVPFAAPPADVDGGRLALKLVFGIGGGLILVVGVAVAVVAAFVTFTNSVIDKVESTAEDFIAEVAQDDWDSAYAMLCEDLRDRPVQDYLDEWESWEADGAEVQPMTVDATEVEVELDDGSRIALTIRIDQSAEALDTSVCGWRDLS